MKPKSLCLSVLIVAFLLASEMPRVHGIFLLPLDLLGVAAKELHSFVRGVATGVTDILLPERAAMPPIQIVVQNVPVENDGRKSREIQTYVDTYNAQETDTTDENKETESSTKNNESENGSNSQEPDTTNEDKETDNSESEKNGSQNGDIPQEIDNSQKTDVTDEEKETDNSAENNGSGSKEGEVAVDTANTQKSDNSQEAEKSSEKQESIGKILDLDNFVKSLIKNLKKCEFKQSKNKEKSNSNIICRW